MSTDVKAAIEQLQAVQADFVKANSERLDKIEKGMPDPLLEDKVAKLLTREGELQDEIKALNETVGSRIEQIEDNISRAIAGDNMADKDQERKAARSFLALANGKPEASVEVGDNEVQQFREYRQALAKYMRYGPGRAGDVMAALSVGSDPDGGYLVTPEMDGDIVQFIFDTSPMRQIANIETISTAEFMGILDTDEASSGWVEEGGTISETDTPALGRYSIKAWKQYAEPKATQEILEDADRNVEAWLSGKIADKLVRTENTAFVTGNGVGKPRGFADYTTGTTDPSNSNWGTPKHIVTGHATGFQADPNLLKPFIDAIHDLKAPYRQNAVWVMNRSTLGEIRKAQNSDGNYQLIVDAQGSVFGTLLGFRVVELEDMADTGANNLSVAFGDFRQAYTIVDRRGISILRDPYTSKGHVKFFATKRVGGDLVNFDALRFLKHSN